MDPKLAASEAAIAEAIESWQEKSDRLARHGDEYKLPEAYQKVALKKILVGKTRENYELWESERDSYEDTLRTVKEYARSKTLDKEASSGKPGVARGNVDTQEEEQWGEQRDWEGEDLSAMNGGKAKGKKGKARARAKAKGKTEVKEVRELELAKEREQAQARVPRW